MRDILSPEAVSVLDEIARERTLLAFDFDGTLAPIVADREAARLRADTNLLLRTVALLYPCAVISGRERSDVAARVAGIPFVGVVGNHGSEAGFGPLDRDVQQRVVEWGARLVDALRGVDGVDVENKRFSIAVHYRRARSWRDAEARVRAAVGALEGARVFGGLAVVNVVPADAPTKAGALRELCRRVGATSAVYAGDDVTDEDAFRSELVRVSIRVGRSEDSAARWYLVAQDDVDALLRALVSARARADGLGARWEGLVRAVGR